MIVTVLRGAPPGRRSRYVTAMAISSSRARCRKRAKKGSSRAIAWDCQSKRARRSAGVSAVPDVVGTSGVAHIADVPHLGKKSDVGAQRSRLTPERLPFPRVGLLICRRGGHLEQGHLDHLTTCRRPAVLHAANKTAPLTVAASRVRAAAMWRPVRRTNRALRHTSGGTGPSSPRRGGRTQRRSLWPRWEVFTDETIIDGRDGYDWQARSMRLGSVPPSMLPLTSQCEMLHTVSVMGFMFPFRAHRLSWT
jgi:hypothetical protein